MSGGSNDWRQDTGVDGARQRESEAALAVGGRGLLVAPVGGGCERRAGRGRCSLVCHVDLDRGAATYIAPVGVVLNGGAAEGDVVAAIGSLGGVADKRQVVPVVLGRSPTRRVVLLLIAAECKGLAEGLQRGQGPEVWQRLQHEFLDLMQSGTDVIEEHALQGRESFSFQRQSPPLALRHEWNADVIRMIRVVVVTAVGDILQIMMTAR
mmetsp:Transcript_28450/g.39127  ORF Transcript_28450/g.39127 Transcript_28450/m.39127 type:complete len:209 (-) Transcript_28450:1792-2418(-)